MIFSGIIATGILARSPEISLRIDELRDGTQSLLQGYAQVTELSSETATYYYNADDGRITLSYNLSAIDGIIPPDEGVNIVIGTQYSEITAITTRGTDVSFTGLNVGNYDIRIQDEALSATFAATLFVKYGNEKSYVRYRNIDYPGNGQIHFIPLLHKDLNFSKVDLSITRIRNGFATIDCIPANFDTNRLYNHGTNYWSEDKIIIIGSKFYTDQYGDTPVADMSFVIETLDKQYDVTTNQQGVVVTLTAVNHPYQFGNYWADAPTLAIGVKLYLNQYKYNTSSFVFELNGKLYTTSFIGVITSIINIDHPYQHNIYWSDDQVLANGSILYIGRSTNAKAANITFNEEIYAISTNAQGVVSITIPIDHPYQHNVYWSDDQILTNGSILYIGRYTNTIAANIAFLQEEYSISTNSQGVVTLTANTLLFAGQPGRTVDLGDFDGYVTNGLPLTALFVKTSGLTTEGINVIKSALDHWSNILRYTMLPGQTIPSEIYNGQAWVSNPLAGQQNKGYVVCINKFAASSNSTLAAASYWYIRNTQNTKHYRLPSIGFFYINSIHEASMLSNVTPGGKTELYNTVLHEMGHAFGIGTAWFNRSNNVLERSFIVNAGDNSPNSNYGVSGNIFYSINTGNNSRTFSQIGTPIQNSGDASYTFAYNPYSTVGNTSMAVSAYNSIYNNTLSAIPLENGMGAGSYGGHWHEGLSVSYGGTGDVRQYYGRTYPGAPALQDELMTPMSEGNLDVPLSKISLGAMADLGWTVDFALADNYEPFVMNVRRSTVYGDSLALKRNNFGGYAEAYSQLGYIVFSSLRRGQTYTIKNETGNSLEIYTLNGNTIGPRITANITQTTQNGIPCLLWTIPTNLVAGSLILLVGPRNNDIIILEIG